MLNRYKTRLDQQARGAPVVALKGVPILFATGEEKCEEDNEFIRWVHRARHLSSMTAHRASANASDVRLERKLHYDYAKLTAKEKVRKTPVRYAFFRAVHEYFNYYCSHELTSGCRHKLFQSHRYWWESSELTGRP